MTPQGTHLIMLVDDEPAQQRLVSVLASRAGWRTVIAADGEAALATLGTRDGMMLDAILVDQALPSAEPVALIAQLHKDRPKLPILLLTALGSGGAAVEALRAGATDFLTKPISPDRLLAALEAAVDLDGPAEELRPLTEKQAHPLGFGDIVGSDPKFRAALAIAAKAARTKVPILIEGEAGTGKELVAGAVRLSSPRERRPWLVVNCAAIPGNAIESELFGHEKGAFTGAFSRQIGKLIDADGGTIYLDEVGNLPPEAQLRLLQLLQSGEVHPIGARGFREVDIRIMAGSTRPLIEKVEAGGFREDLYYRLASVQIALPRLRDRPADIPALARHLLARLGSQPGLRSLGITDEALALLSGYVWPGNVRQLQTALFRAAIHCDGAALTADAFPQVSGRNVPAVQQHRASEAGVALYLPDGNMRALDAIEADVIRLAIGHYRGRMTEVARRLGVGRSTLYRKLAELGIGEAA